MKKIVALVLVLSICLALCACGVSKAKVEEDLQGGWEYVWYASAVGIYCFSYLEFDDGIVTYTFIRGQDTEVQYGTYKIKGKKILIELEDREMELSYSYEDDELVLVNKTDGSIENEYKKFY